MVGLLAAFPTWPERGVANICIKNSSWYVQPTCGRVRHQTEFGGSIGKTNVYENVPVSNASFSVNMIFLKRISAVLYPLNSKFVLVAMGRWTKPLKVISVSQINPATFLCLRVEESFMKCDILSVLFSNSPLKHWHLCTCGYWDLVALISFVYINVFSYMSPGALHEKQMCP